MSKPTIASAFKSAETITPSDLAAIVERDPKLVRAYLRKVAARNQSEHKGSRWQIDRATAEAAVEHFKKARRMTAES